MAEISFLERLELNIFFPLNHGGRQSLGNLYNRQWFD